jgi:hypothetical protein
MASQTLRLPDQVRRYRVSRELLARSSATLRTTGAGQREAVLLWRGRVLGPDSMEATAVVVPRQITGPRHFNVPLDERMRIADEASLMGELVVAQMHTHPSEAFHSRADDELAIIKHIGAISIVVPNFGMKWEGDLTDTSIHIHLGRCRWRELSGSEVAALFEVVP